MAKHLIKKSVSILYACIPIYVDTCNQRYACKNLKNTDMQHFTERISIGSCMQRVHFPVPTSAHVLPSDGTVGQLVGPASWRRAPDFCRNRGRVGGVRFGTGPVGAGRAQRGWARREGFEPGASVGSVWCMV
jgi:hypothetical protein